MNRQAITRMRGRTRRYAGMAAGFAYWRSRLPALIVASGMVLAVGLFASPAAAVTASITLKPSAGPLTSTVTPNIAATAASPDAKATVAAPRSKSVIADS